MANETETLTFETIRSWSASEQRKRMADPAQRPEIERVIAERAQQNLSRAQNEISDIEAKRLENQQRQEAEALAAQQAAVAEQERLERMTVAERQAEQQAKDAAAKEEEKKEQAAKIVQAKDEAFLSTLPSHEKAAELERRRLAVETAEREKAEADAVAAQVEAEKVAAEEAATAKVQADAAAAVAAAEAERIALEEKQRLAAEEAAKPRQKIVRDFQATDENGQPIGRHTHLEADTEAEMLEKMQESYVNAVRYAERMKKRAALKPTPAREEVPILILTDEQKAQLQEDLKSKDAAKAASAKVELELDEIRKERAEARDKAEWERRNREGAIFAKNHKSDYLPNVANANMIFAYIKEKNLDHTANNYEIAFHALEERLAQPAQVEAVPDPEAVAAEAKAKADAEAARIAAEAKAAADAEALKKIEQERAANSQPIPASVAVTAPAPVAEVVAPTPAETPAAAANPPVPARKLPAGGIEPGSLHGGRPTGTVSVPTGLTKQDIAKMPKDEYKRRLRDPKFVAQVNALFAKK